MARDNNSKNKKNKNISSPKVDEFKIRNENKDFYKITIDEITDDNGLAYELAEAFIEDVSHTQLRNYYAHIKKIDRYSNEWSEIKPQLLLLKPRLASKLAQEKISYGFYNFMEFCIEKINQGTDDEIKEKNFERFVQLFESIVAYHNYLGE
ncbi:type III-A CRISPR-associated protein Csm2 [Methanobrevibacter millerae]|uniref:CRISPR system Cms protein Csm2 n=1 Tax=Methanobrevibacter millerae TaxID=230361 RepID=A0A0U3E9G9_9EURY|nr:type III-A CRISPR-associated protein Csm2 [Methanobrevibacter millerae]ALT68968.1 CRISPR-associated protein Csm2 family [Methanobrevibacter millerae]